MGYIGFKALTGKLEGQGMSAQAAKAESASIGRKKYGKKKFQKAASGGYRLGHK